MARTGLTAQALVAPPLGVVRQRSGVGLVATKSKVVKQLRSCWPLGGEPCRRFG
jgi:hypothetical protein